MGLLIEVKQNCPTCGAHVPSAHPVGQPFVCPQCGALLQHEVRAARREGYIALGMAFALAVILGARGLWIVFWGFALWFPCILATGSITLRYFPPKLEPWDGKRFV